MVAFLDNNLRHHEGVVAVGPCDGLGPAAVVKELPPGCVGVVNGPVDLERLAGIRVFRLVADDIGGDGDIAALVVLDDQAVQAEGLGIGIPVFTPGAADGPAGEVVAFLDNNLRHHEGVVAVGPCDGLSARVAVIELPLGSIGIVNSPVDFQCFTGIWVNRRTLDTESPAGVAGGPGAVGGIVGHGNGMELGNAGGQRMGTFLQGQRLVVGRGIRAAVGQLNRDNIGRALDGRLCRRIGVSEELDGLVAVIHGALGHIAAGVVLDRNLQQVRQVGRSGGSALDADGFGGLQAPGLLGGVPKQDDGVNLGLADRGRVRTGHQALGGVILLGVFRGDRGDLIGVLPVFSKGYVLCGFIATFDQSEILIAMVNGTCFTVLDQDRVLNGCQVVRSGDSRLCDFEMGGKGIHGAAGGHFQCIVNLFTV